MRGLLQDTLELVRLLPQDTGHHLIKRVIGVGGDHIVADGQAAHAPQAAAPGVPRAGRDDGGDAGGALPPVRMEVKADARCAVVAAASVLAKVERDGLMEELADPGYGWASNKGYASPAHIRALARLGAGEQHRRSWRLPGLDGPSR